MTWTRRRSWNDYGAVRYSEDQPREENGRFGSGGGDSNHSNEGAKAAATHWAESFDGAKSIRGDIERSDKRGTEPRTADGKAMKAALEAAPAHEGSLYRGETTPKSPEAVMRQYTPGSTQEVSAKAFSANSNVSYYTQSSSGRMETQVVTTVSGADHALELGPLTGGMHGSDAEYVVRGSFQVDSRSLETIHHNYSGGFDEQIVHVQMSPTGSARASWNLRYSEDQPRDEHGRFGSGGGSDTAKAAPAGFGISTEMLGAAGSMTYSAWNREYGSTPGGQAYYAAVQTWTGGEDYPIAIDVASGHPTTEDGKVIAEALDNAPKIGAELYRGGISLKETNAILATTGRDSFMGGPNSLQAGDTFSLRPSSFSTDPEVARGFVANGLTPVTEGTPDAKGNVVNISNNMVLDVQSGARGAPIQRLSGAPEEHEVITGGKFEVTGPPHTQFLNSPQVFTESGHHITYVNQIASVPVRQIQ